LSALRPILRDCHIESAEFYRIALGKISGTGLLNQQRALLRILERISWYDISYLFDITFLKQQTATWLIGKL